MIRGRVSKKAISKERKQPNPDRLAKLLSTELSLKKLEQWKAAALS